MTRSEGRARVSARQLDRLARGLSDRDRLILRTVSDFGLLRTKHIQAMCFSGHTTDDAAARICRRVLQRLATWRIMEPIERRIGGIRAGSDGTVWRLGPTGDRLLRTEQTDKPRARRKEPSLRFLEHRLLIADVAARLTQASKRGAIELLTVEPEPASWRRYQGSFGGTETLKPDLYVVTASDHYEDHYFVECDRGTESTPTLLKQCVAYDRYRRSGRPGDGVFPRVLWLMPTIKRRDQFRHALTAERVSSADLFWVFCHHELEAVVAGGAV